jgi:hypothetical protein
MTQCTENGAPPALPLVIHNAIHKCSTTSRFCPKIMTTMVTLVHSALRGQFEWHLTAQTSQCPSTQHTHYVSLAHHQLCLLSCFPRTVIQRPRIPLPRRWIGSTFVYISSSITRVNLGAFEAHATKTARYPCSYQIGTNQIVATCTAPHYSLIGTMTMHLPVRSKQ